MIYRVDFGLKICDQNISFIFKFRELRMLDFHFYFFLLCWLLKIKLNCQGHFEMSTMAFAESTMSSTQVQDVRNINNDTRAGRPKKTLKQ